MTHSSAQASQIATDLPQTQPGSYDTPAAIAAAIVISFVGNAVVMGMPMIVGALADDLGFGEQQVGWLASADLGGMFLASLLTAMVITRVNRRQLAMVGIIIALMANLLSSQFHDFTTLFYTRVIAGIGGGICYSLGVGCLAGTHHTARNFSILMFALVTINALELYSFPVLSDVWGVNGIYYAFCGAFVLCFFAVPKLPAFAAEPTAITETADGHKVRIPGYLPKLCLLAVSCFYITIGSFWAYIERAGVDAGLSDEFIANTLTIGTLFTLLGCFVATWLSNKAGQSKPLLVALLTMVGAMALLALGINPTVFIIGNFMFNVMWLFTDIYQLGTISNVDHSGRYAALIPGAQGLAQTIAPTAAGFLLAANLGYGAVMLLGAAGSLSAFVIYAFVYRQLRQLAPELADAS
ncbi:MFS transporter [Aestuariicella hydrocarbonica]|uniref:MFS transporter n=1 Tax=Pseudomaricurvus hydrocarbonicus TaxID=1470433 RepID=A0A9E5MNZ0_9GAMM|nr:MFS transporter [Aestuariicella hydrocarbonica]NHO67761.1 MFS transporter [Aestuariicella hydrocarbonica]